MREGPTRRVVLGQGLGLVGALAVGGRAPAAQDQRPPGLRGGAELYGGVNIAGGEFGPLLGKHWHQYVYPEPQNIDYYAGLGFRLIRVPFKWERLQPVLGQALAPEDLKLLTASVEHALSRDLRVVLDPHNYAKRALAEDGWKQTHMIGSARVPNSAFADFWARLADAFRNDPRVLFGLMNEPTDIAPAGWLQATNEAISAIRAHGAGNLVALPHPSC